MPRTGRAMSDGANPAVATWYSSGWNTWWLRWSMIVTSTGSSARRVPAPIPPNPAPITTPCDLCPPPTSPSYGGLSRRADEPGPMRRSLRLTVAALAAGAILLPVPVLAKSPEPEQACTGNPNVTPRIDVGSTYGFYALPAKKPTGIVTYFHGYGHNAEDWREHLTQTAQRDGVIAIALNYVANEGDGGTMPRRGWWVSEGAAASVTATQQFAAACKSATSIVAYGISMGGNASGLAAASHATRADGQTPLFDYWWDIEGATNVIETYAGARALAGTGNEFATHAQADIEKEMGGPIETDPQTYADHAVVTHAEDIKVSGIKGVVMVHGVGDGLVPHDQSREMQVRLRQVGIPVEFFSAVTHGPNSEAGTTLDGYASPVVPHDSPFAGHGSETSNTQLVIKTGFDRLAGYFNDDAIPTCRESVVDGTTGLMAGTPTPAC